MQACKKGQGCYSYWQDIVSKESDDVKNNFIDLYGIIEKLDQEFLSMKDERKRRSNGDESLLSLMKNYNDHKTGMSFC